MKLAVVLACAAAAVVVAEPQVAPQYGPPQGPPGGGYSGGRPRPRPGPQYGAPSSGNGFGGSEDQYEPANYEFKYDVSDGEYGVRFGHQEARQGDVAQGEYYVLLPDGRTQHVQYVADQGGYRPTITYDDAPAGFNRGGGGGGGGGSGYARGGGYAK